MGGESFHFRHFSSDFGVHLVGFFSQYVCCFGRLLPHWGSGGFLQWLLLGRFLEKCYKRKKKGGQAQYSS